MKYRTLIHDAWEFTIGNKSLIKWYALPAAILSTVSGIVFFVYQYKATVTSDLFSDTHQQSFLYKVVTTYIQFFNTDTKTGLIVTALLISGVLLNIFFPVFANGAMIEYTARAKHGEKLNMGNALSYGLLNFLPLFEYSLLIRSFAFLSVFGEMMFILRNFGTDWFKILMIPIILMFIISLMLTLFFTYTEYFIVIDKKKILSSMKLSTILVIKHWQHTFLILILMAIIGARIILNIAIVLLIPLLIIGVSALFFYTAKIYAAGIVVGGLVGILLLLFTSYLNATVDVWAKAVWVYTFIDLTHKEEMDARGNIISGSDSIEIENQALS